jgi:hypothetical protein
VGGARRRDPAVGPALGLDDPGGQAAFAQRRGQDRDEATVAGADDEISLLGGQEIL